MSRLAGIAIGTGIILAAISRSNSPEISEKKVVNDNSSIIDQDIFEIKNRPSKGIKIGPYFEFEVHDTIKSLDRLENTENIIGQRDEDRPFFNFDTSIKELKFKDTEFKLDRSHIKIEKEFDLFYNIIDNGKLTEKGKKIIGNFGYLPKGSRMAPFVGGSFDFSNQEIGMNSGIYIKGVNRGFYFGVNRDIEGNSEDVGIIFGGRIEF